MALADDVAAIRRMWIARTGSAPDAQIEQVIRDVARTIKDTNQGRFEFIADFFISGPGQGAFEDPRDESRSGQQPADQKPAKPAPGQGAQRGTPVDNQPTGGTGGGGVRAQPVVTPPADLPNQGAGSLVLDDDPDGTGQQQEFVTGPVETPAAEEPEFQRVDINADIATVIGNYESGRITESQAMNAMMLLYKEAGIPDTIAQNQAMAAINAATPPSAPSTPTGGTGAGQTGGVDPTPVDAGEVDQNFISHPSEGVKDFFLAGGAFDRPRFAFDRFLNRQDFDGRGFNELSPFAQGRLRSDFDNRLSQFALFGGGVPTHGPAFQGQAPAPLGGEAGFTAFLNQDAPTSGALADRLRLLQDLRAQDFGAQFGDGGGTPLSPGEIQVLEGFFFDADNPELSEERLFRAGIQPGLARIRSPFFADAFERGAAQGFERFRAQNPATTFLDYAQEIGLF